MVGTKKNKKLKLSKDIKPFKKKVSLSSKSSLKKKVVTSNKVKKPLILKSKPSVITKPTDKSNNLIFSNKLLRKITFDTYFQFLWFLLYILLFVMFCDFIIKLSVFSIAANTAIYQANFNFSYKMYTSMILLTFFLIYFLFAYEAARINLNFKILFKSILNLSIFLYIVESILFIISYFSFLKNYYLLFNIISANYLYYCLLLILIKYVVLIFVTVLAYRLFVKLKRKFIWY